MLRHQTTDQRSKREQLKEKRKALLNAQLAKVRQRKMKTKLDGTQDNQGAGHNHEEDEAHEEAPAVKKLEVEIQERRDTKSGVPHVRDWDRGKVDFLGEWTSRRQDDRESEFTPPSVYFSDDKRQGYGKWAKREQDKPKMAFKWSEGQGGGHKEPPQAKPKSSYLPQPQSSTPVPSQPTMLFIDYSSAFNTIVPSKLITKLRILGLNTSLCNWILDFLTGRPQVVSAGSNTSATLILNTVAPQGCVLCPLLYSLFTHDFMVRHDSNTIIKFADDTTVVGLITDNDETAYREEVRDLAGWCQNNNLSLN